MPRQAVNFHTEDHKIDPKPAINLDEDREPEIVEAGEDVLRDKAYADELAFNEEPVTVRLEPSAEKNAATRFPIWNNGKGCEVWMNGRWVEMPYIPVGVVITIKRKYVEILARAKFDRVDTGRTEVEHLKDDSQPNNIIQRVTSAASAFSIINDPNPRGVAWLTALYRRNG